MKYKCAARNRKLINNNNKMERKTIGIILIILGIIMIAYTGFNYVTTENVVDLGPLQINKEVNHPVQWSPIIGGILLVGGIVIIALDKRVRV
jgi:uncharacterized membrane protein YidH (DUF202 family)